MIRIRGKDYDVSEFRHIHPGGSELLDLCIGEPDSTALFESYHAFCDQSGIEAIMRKYEHEPNSAAAADADDDGMFEPGGFYCEVRSRVRYYFATGSTKSAAAGAAKADRNLTRSNVKATWGWRTTVFVLWAGFAALRYESLFRPDGVVRTLCSFGSGVLLTGLVFNVTCNAVTHALSTSPLTNKLLSLLHQPLVLSNHLLSVHHSLGHHRSTGDVEHDPNMGNALPFFRKSKYQPNTRWSIGGWSDKLLIVAFVFIHAVFPGPYLVIVAHQLGRTGRRRLPKLYSTPTQVLQHIVQYVIGVAYYVSMIRYGGWYHTLVHVTGSNIAYFLGSLPNHDMFDSQLANENNTATKYSLRTRSISNMVAGIVSRTTAAATTPTPTIDWGRLQVNASANFVTDWALLTRYLGGSNYHIERHLFPTVCGHRLAEIAPIVRACCVEFDIPYTRIDNPIFAFGQVFDMLIRVADLESVALPVSTDHNSV